MTFPPNPDKYDQPGILTAADRIAHLRQHNQLTFSALPATAILTYQPHLLRYAKRRYRGKQFRGLAGTCYTLRRAESVCVLGEFGVGAPVVGVLVEELAALGVVRIISIGIAGGLGDGLAAGDTILCTGAVRGEGTSHHYLPPGEKAQPDANLTAQLAEGLESEQLGQTWTTDAPYRETEMEIEHYRQRGVLTVEMEAAALFVVGWVAGVQTAALFVVGDTLHKGKWRLGFDTNPVERALERTLDAVIEAVA